MVMAEDIKQQLATLAALQHAENAINKLESKLVGVQAQIEKIGSEAAPYEEKVALQRQTSIDLKKQYREDEVEIKAIEVRVGKNNEKLRAVKTNKEYQSMLKEIDELKKKASELEDRMLASLDLIENTDAEVATLEKSLADVQLEIKTKQEEISHQADDQRLQMEGYQQEREDVWQNLSDNLKKLFEKVKKQGGGIAVAPIVDGVCQVCRMNIPPQMYNELLRLDEIRLCPNCQRIIYPKKLIESENG